MICNLCERKEEHIARWESPNIPKQKREEVLQNFKRICHDIQKRESMLIEFGYHPTRVSAWFGDKIVAGTTSEQIECSSCGGLFIDAKRTMFGGYSGYICDACARDRASVVGRNAKKKQSMDVA